MVIIDTAPGRLYHKDEMRYNLTRLLLVNAECPVMIAPEVFEPIEEIVFCYDGSASAAFAMKQLTYLLPGLENKRLLLCR